MRERCYIVTGGAGFIGSHVVDLILGRGDSVVVLDDFSTGKRQNLARWKDDPRLTIIETDIREGVTCALLPVLGPSHAVNAVVHLAAQTSVVASIDEPAADIGSNYMATAHVVQYARAYGKPKVVFASSAAVYGDAVILPVREDHPQSPIAPYGANKLASEVLLGCGARTMGVPSCCLRFFNVYGPRQAPDNGYTGVVSAFLRCAFRGEALTVHGDGKQTRDFVYVRDVARAIVAATAADWAQDGAAINIGSGRETAIGQLADLVLASTGRRGEITHTAARVGDSRRSCADVGLAEALLDFCTEVLLHDGLKETARWFGKEHGQAILP